MTDHKIIEGQDIILSGEGIAFVNNVLTKLTMRIAH